MASLSGQGQHSDRAVSRRDACDLPAVCFPGQNSRENRFETAEPVHAVLFVLLPAISLCRVTLILPAFDFRAAQQAAFEGAHSLTGFRLIPARIAVQVRISSGHALQKVRYVIRAGRNGRDVRLMRA